MDVKYFPHLMTPLAKDRFECIDDYSNRCDTGCFEWLPRKNICRCIFINDVISAKTSSEITALNLYKNNSVMVFLFNSTMTLRRNLEVGKMLVKGIFFRAKCVIQNGHTQKKHILHISQESKINQESRIKKFCLLTFCVQSPSNNRKHLYNL